MDASNAPDGAVPGRFPASPNKKTAMKKPNNDKNAVTVKVPEVISDPLKYRVLKDSEIVLTKEKAFAFLELDTFPGERQVIENHVQSLFNQWAAGRFIWEHVIIATCVCDRRVFRINGQHTCWMRVNIPKHIEPKVRHIEYGVNDEEHLRSLYCVFDRAKSRSPAHVIKASLVGTPLTAELWPSVIGNLSAGLKFYLYERSATGTVRVEPCDMVTLIEDKYNNLFRVVGVAWQELYEWQPIRKAACIGAMFATFTANVKDSLEFWNTVGTGLNLTDKSDARWQLRKYLDTHSQSSVFRGAGKKPVSGEDVYRVCVNAWNRWRKNEKVLMGLRPTDKRVKAI